MEYIFSGMLGLGAVHLALAAGLTAAVAFLTATARNDRTWFKLGAWAFGAHAVGVIMALVNLFGMILTHQYQYHYVFNHTSNELPVYYAVACLWEGQEGSFMLWQFWHAVLGLIFLRVGGRWRAGVLGLLSTIQVILASMVLGIYLSPGVVQVTYLVLMLAPAAYLLHRTYRAVTLPAQLGGLAAAMLFLPGAANILLHHHFSWQWPFVLEALFIASATGLLVWGYVRGGLTLSVLSIGLTLVALVFVAMYVPFEGWKIGSSPFLLMREARPDLPVFAMDPNFVPTNGNGLNALLQNYWMVIHPPTLFLGFAATAIPFCFALAALLQKDYASWIKPAAPWTIFSVAVLGVGIIMGGYWAYETLNFGGYWNWDPVENASLVPWLTGVGSLHAMLAYQKGKTNLHLTFTLVAATFLLVLYSTFLTRSGILGEASVHSFTDLGLSGQLLLLLLAYVGFVLLVFVHHWRRLPHDRPTETIWTRDFFLFLAAAALALSALEISMFTSLPVINKILGTKYAPPANVPLFYFKWNVWFGILIATLSAIGQFFFWTKIEKKELTAAIFRPLFWAVLATIGIMATMLAVDWGHEPRWKFGFQELWFKGIEAAQESGNWGRIIMTYLGNGLLMLADELLLLAGLFALFANGYIIFRLVRRSKRNWRHVGGAVAHIGFALMLVGILFSSGYQDTVTINLSPQEMGETFDEKQRGENVQLFLKTPKVVKGYRVSYEGAVNAERPIRNLKVFEGQGDEAKVIFADRLGHRYYLPFPTKFFRRDGLATRAAAGSTPEYDLDKLKFFIEEQIDLFQPKMVNERTVYRLKFTTLDSARSFELQPEAELSEGMGIISHPDRKIFWNKDLYVHVSGVSTDIEHKWKLLSPDRKVELHEVFTLGNYRFTIEKVESLDSLKKFANTDLVARLTVRVEALDTTKLMASARRAFMAKPMLVLDRNGTVMIDGYIKELGVRLAFVRALPEENRLVVRILEREPRLDFITINAIAKPYINLLWLGTLVMAAGFCLAIYRRLKERKDA